MDGRLCNGANKRAYFVSLSLTQLSQKMQIFSFDPLIIIKSTNGEKMLVSKFKLIVPNRAQFADSVNG